MSASDLVAHQVQPGEVRNPKGINQYSYKQDFEKTVDALLASSQKFSWQPVDGDEGKKASCLICGLRKCDAYLGSFRYAHEACLHAIEGKTRGEIIGEITVRLAMAGDEKMLPEILKRLWPAVKEVDLRVPGSDPAALYDGVAAYFTRRREDGADPEPAAKRTNGDGGVAP